LYIQNKYHTVFREYTFEITEIKKLKTTTICAAELVQQSSFTDFRNNFHISIEKGCYINLTQKVLNLFVGILAPYFLVITGKKTIKGTSENFWPMP
jgi:hypothetical protein